MSCNFCGKNQDQVTNLIQGQDANICNICLKAAKDIVAFSEVAAIGRKHQTYLGTIPETAARRSGEGMPNATIQRVVYAAERFAQK